VHNWRLNKISKIREQDQDLYITRDKLNKYKRIINENKLNGSK